MRKTAAATEGKGFDTGRELHCTASGCTATSTEYKVCSILYNLHSSLSLTPTEGGGKGTAGPGRTLKEMKLKFSLETPILSVTSSTKYVQIPK